MILKMKKTCYGGRMDAIEAIKTRVSCRKFLALEIPRATLADIADCARLAPCGYNRQRWMFVAVIDRELLGRIAMEAKYGRFIAEAGACFAVFVAEGEETMLEDGCAATENIIIAAQSYGLGSCWVNSFRKDHSKKVEALLRFPEGLELAVLLSLGYPADDERRTKKSLAEVLRWNAF
jgi:nitroreductase